MKPEVVGNLFETVRQKKYRILKDKLTKDFEPKGDDKYLTD